ncbi:S26 family signal peptidase [Nonomuraea sp. NPDC004186]
MNGWVLAVVGGAVALGLAYVRRRFVAVTITGTSMAPTYSGGERVLVVRAGVDRLRRGDIVVVRWAATDSIPLLLIKRVAGVAGDPIPADVATAVSRPAGTPIPAGKFIVLGDNSDWSLDSRTVGFFDGESLLGTTVKRRA